MRRADGILHESCMVSYAVERGITRKSNEKGISTVVRQ